MKKNKIITLILALAVCSSLILSLCSFTTIKEVDGSSLVYNPRYNVNLEYVYHRQTTTLNEYYKGVIPSFNQILYEATSNTVSTNRASDYVIVSNTSLNYSGVIFSEVSNIGDIELESEDSSIAYFPGNFSLSGLFDVSSNNSVYSGDYIEFDSSTTSVSSIDAFVKVSGFYFNESNGEINSFSNRQFDFNASDNAIPIVDILDAVYSNLYLANSIPASDGTFFITELIFEIEDYYEFESVTTSMKYYNNYDVLSENVRTLHYFTNALYALNYDNGLNDGYNQGVSQAPSIWGGVGSFLENTIGSFMEFEFIPNITIGGVLAIFVGAALLLAFLKVFAGG